MSGPDVEPRAGRGRRIATRFAIVAVVTALSLVLAEGGLRVALSVRGTAYSEAHAREVLREISSRSKDTIPLPGARAGDLGPGDVWGVVHPFIGWETNFAYEMLGHDMRQMVARSPEDAADQPFRVLVLGGSVAAIFHQLGVQHLEPLLEAEPALGGRKVQWRCYARGAYKQPQMLQYLTLMFSLGIRPDLVVLLDGFNEVSLGAANHAGGLHPVWPSQFQWLPLVTSLAGRPEAIQLYGQLQQRQYRVVMTCQDALGGPYLPCALFGQWKLFQAKRQERAYRASTAEFAAVIKDLSPREMMGPPWPAGRRGAVIEAVRNWQESSRLMHEICTNKGIPFLHILQPTLYDPGAKPITDEEREKGKIDDTWLFGVEEGYPLLRQAGRLLAGEGVAYVDASKVFEEVEETLYYDLCHFAERGNELLAEFVAPRLIELVRTGK